MDDAGVVGRGQRAGELAGDLERLIAYATDGTSGTPNIFVRPFPDTGAIWQISTDGGIDPVWSRDGTELFYWQDTSLMAVAVNTENGLSFQGNPQTVVTGPWVTGGGSTGPQYDVHPDGDRFLMIRSEGTTQQRRVDLIIGWLDDLQRRVPRR